MKIFKSILLLCLASSSVFAQKYVSKNAEVSFFSKTPAENISAINKTSTAILSTADQKVAAVMVMRNFKFERPLMEEHFNENYLETSKFPKSTFMGTYTGEVDYTKNGKYNVQMNGDLTLHGVKKQISFPATLTVTNGKIIADAKTQVALADYKIEVPKLVFYKIAEKIEVTIHIDFNKSSS